jgi:hypothetical protein
MSRDLSYGLTCRHFEDRCRFHAEVRFLMVVTRPAQFALLLWRSHHLTSLCHNRVLLKGFSPSGYHIPLNLLKFIISVI